ncbi:MAG: DUF1947 domain-containing protein [Candidatus Heimdallarchaeaceae archaeon]|jgi:PUA domain protein
MQIKSRKFLSKKEKKALQSNLQEIYGNDALILFQLTDNIEEAKTDEGNFIVKNNRIWFFSYEKLTIPSIFCLRESEFKLPKITVDIGAIRFITNGADVMAPGIVYFEDEIKKNTVIAIHEEKADTIIAVGLALISSQEFDEVEKGKVIKTLHYLNDQIWKLQL